MKILFSNGNHDGLTNMNPTSHYVYHKISENTDILRI